MYWYHIVAFTAGFILDLIVGDPHSFPHPIRLIGGLIGTLEHKLNLKGDQSQSKRTIRRGLFMVVLVLFTTLIVASAILASAYMIHPIVGIVVESIMTYQILATKCLRDESMKVYDELLSGDLSRARTAVSMIVGRDTEALDEIGVAKAAIETVAENTSDGVIAPMIYTALLGPVIGFAYKAINTMDSMVGYKNERFLYFGRCAAKLDDWVNYLPSRISAILMITACLFGKRFHGKDAYRIWRRDRYNHASKNSAQTESVCAGALQIKLAGDASYFGEVHHKPTIGDDIRPVTAEDIRYANRLMYLTAFLGAGFCILFMCLFYLILR